MVTAGEILCIFPYSMLFVLAVSVKLVFITKLLLRRRYPLSQIPGPNVAPWTRLWLLKILYDGKMPENLVKLHKQYGPIVRIGPKHVIISDPTSIRRVLVSGSTFTRGPWFDTLRLHPETANVISERDPAKHQRLRQIIGPGLNGTGFSGMETIVDKHVKDWLSMIRSQYVSNTKETVKFDLSTSIPFLTVDLISHLCLGESFGCTEKQSDKYGFISAMRAGMMVQQYTSIFLEINKVMAVLGRLPLFRPLVFPTPKDTIGVGETMQRIKSILQDRKTMPEDSPLSCMVDSFFKRGLPREQAYSELIIILAGGTDTTATAAQGIIFSLLSNPMAYALLQAEIDSYYDFRINDPDSIIKDTEARKLPYLQACIFEGLRKFPPLFQLRERVVSQVETLHGFELPLGTFVGINGLATQIDSVYGENAEEFVPERWLTEDKVQLKQMHQTLQLVFGYGGSKCLGISMAYMELNKLIFEIFSNFDVSFYDPKNPWKRKGRGIFVQSDFFVRLRDRRAT